MNREPVVSSPISDLPNPQGPIFTALRMGIFTEYSRNNGAVNCIKEVIICVLASTKISIEYGRSFFLSDLEDRGYSVKRTHSWVLEMLLKDLTIRAS